MTDGVTASLQELIALQRYAVMSYHRLNAPVSLIGRNLTKVRGRGMDFAEVRNYQAGDEIRHMEWRVTARTGKPHVKLYQEERERPVVILTDFSPSMYFGTHVAFKSVIAARLAALLAWTVIKQGDRVGGLLFSATEHHEFTPRGRDAGALPFLAALSRYTEDIKKSPQQSVPETTRTLNHALQRVRRVSKPGSLVVIISDYYSMNEDSEQHLGRLRVHNDVLAYQLCDAIELAPPKPQQYAVTDGQRDLLIDTGARYLQQAYRQYCDQRQLKLQTQFRRLKIPYELVTAEQDLPKLVRQTFPRKMMYG